MLRTKPFLQFYNRGLPENGSTTRTSPSHDWALTGNDELPLVCAFTFLKMQKKYDQNHVTITTQVKMTPGTWYVPKNVSQNVS